MSGTAFDPSSMPWSEIHESRFLIRVEIFTENTTAAATPAAGTPAQNAANVGYWDSMTGGEPSRNISQRKRPGSAEVEKIPGMHLNLSQVTLTRAWNTKAEARAPIGDLIKSWVNEPQKYRSMKLKVTQMIMPEEGGELIPVDEYVGPIVSYSPPKGNSEGDGFVKETLTIDPISYRIK
ncbi:hypothetical protein [Deinococcus kurensis]|uniref:hypothetical protein n=1 Tax=Deinococcus kurensis TaxID=2662757 RepID=UPI0012D3020F|nr:hypothetical protein [Deinococcus kurensis]